MYDHEHEDQLKGCITAIGGKWTTSRSLAKKVVDLAATKLEAKFRACATHTTPTYGGSIGAFHEFANRAVREHPDQPESIVRHLAKNYGSRTDAVLTIAREREAFGQCLTECDLAAQVIYAVRHEMARSVDEPPPLLPPRAASWVP